MAVIGATGIEPVNFLEQYAKGLQVGAGRRQLERQEIDRIKAAEQQRTMNELYAQSLGAGGALDTNALVRGMARQGLGSAIPEFMAGQAEIAQKTAAAAKSTQEADKMFWETSRNQLALIPDNDQTAYQAWAANMVRRAPWTADLLPATLDKANKQRLLMTADMALPKGEKVERGGGTEFRNPYTGEPIGSIIMNVPESPEVFAQDVARATAGAPRTSISTKGDTAEEVKKAESRVAEYNTIRDRAVQGRRTLPSLQRAASALEKFETGFGSEAATEARRVLVSFGLADAEAAEKVQSADAFAVAVKDRILFKLSQQAGTQTEGDAQRAEDTWASFRKLTDSNKFLIDLEKAVIAQDNEQLKFYDDWEAKNGTYRGAAQAWRDGPGSKSLFDRPELKKYANEDSKVPPPPPGFKINPSR
jgi:hypothetical protein